MSFIHGVHLGWCKRLEGSHAFWQDGEAEESLLEGQREVLLKGQAKRKRYEGDLPHMKRSCH